MATEPPREPRYWTTDEAVIEMVNACPDRNKHGIFVTKDGREMQVYCTYLQPLTPPFDPTDSAMHTYGFTDFLRFVAVGMDDGLPYAVWEIYCKNGALRSKAIDVDANNKGKGIGTGMKRIIEEVGGTHVEPSGSATDEGEKFIASWK